MSKEGLPQELSRLQDVESFDLLLDNVVEVLKRIKEKSPDARLGYVAGIISSEGPEYLERNRRILQGKTERFREQHDFPIFCANDIFSPELVDKLGHDEANYIFFWRKLFEKGLITDVIMTTGWERSQGASDEHLMAKLLKLNIKYE